MKENKNNNSFLGIGWGFPPTFSKKTNGLEMTAGKEDIESSLEILFSTSVGERIMQNKYGCNLNHLLFESINTSLITYTEGLVRQAILMFEPRIKLNNLTIDTADQNNGVVNIMVEYTIKTTNSRYNYVYPYYISELSKN